jgi:hypothetical protein
MYDLGVSWLSPGLELNDVGFLLQTDQVKQWVFTQYRVTNPVGIFRSQYYNAYQSWQWDFDGRTISRDYEMNCNVQFRNYWFVGAGLSYNELSVSNADLRGGPAIRYPGNIGNWLWLSTDRRKKIQVSVNPQWVWGENNYFRNTNLDLDCTWRPFNALNISISPSYSRNRNQLQYVATGSASGQERYVMAEIDQTTIRVAMRMTFMITPNLSVQYWGQPFGTAGKYNGYKYITDGTATGFAQRFMTIPGGWLTFNGSGYTIDENNNGNSAFSFSKPDFNIGQFRSNMVVRWEYIPGSTLFLVWAQEMNGAFYDRADPLHKKNTFDFNQQVHTIFLVKFTYRFVV